MSKRTAIVAAGTAGLHLGLYLQQKGVQSTIFTDKKIKDYPNLRLPNTVAHHAVTIAREDDLGVNHWPDAGYFGHYYFIGMPGTPIEFYGDLTTGPSRAVDYRIYLPTLMADFQDRGHARQATGPRRFARRISHARRRFLTPHQRAVASPGRPQVPVGTA
jgi:hypothetical protein